MAKPRRFCMIAGLVLVLPSGLVHGQETTAWLSPFGSESVRVLGLGGAFVGLADDSSSVVVNPAGLTTVPRSLEALGVIGFDENADWSTGGGFGAFRPSKRLGIGFQLAHVDGLDLRSTRLASVATALPAAEIRDYAVGAAFAITRPGEFSVGLTYRNSRLSSESLTESPRDHSFTAGLLFRPLNPWSPRIGLSYRHELQWEAPRTDAPGSHHIGAPSVASVGVSWYYEPARRARLLFTLQPDYIFYSQLSDGAPDAERARNEIDFRSGVELTRPFGCWTGCGSMFQLRLAVVNSAPVPFVARRATVGEAVGQGPERRWTLAVGATLGIEKGHGRFKIEMAWDERSKTVYFGLGWRFPQAFRAGIVDDTHR
jgi:hypothetical protein